MSRAWSGISRTAATLQLGPHEIGELVVGAVLRRLGENTHGVDGEQRAIMTRLVVTLPGGVQGDDNGDGLWIAEADVLDGDDVQTVPQVRVQLRARRRQVEGAEHGVAHLATPD